MMIIAVCIFSATLNNAEFMNLFQSMVNNCGMGSKIAITKYENISMTVIKEDNRLEFNILKKYFMRLKTLREILYY